MKKRKVAPIDLPMLVVKLIEPYFLAGEFVEYFQEFPETLRYIEQRYQKGQLSYVIQYENDLYARPHNLILPPLYTLSQTEFKLFYVATFADGVGIPSVWACNRFTVIITADSIRHAIFITGYQTDKNDEVCFVENVTDSSPFAIKMTVNDYYVDDDRMFNMPLNRLKFYAKIK